MDVNALLEGGGEGPSRRVLKGRMVDSSEESEEDVVDALLEGGGEGPSRRVESSKRVLKGRMEDSSEESGEDVTRRTHWMTWSSPLSSVVEPELEPQGAGTFGQSQSRSWSRYTEAPAPAPGQTKVVYLIIIHKE